jgi:hypothetical protein
MTLAALPLNYLRTLQKTLHAARLHPVSVTVGIPFMMKPDPAVHEVVLYAHEDGIDMGIKAGNGIAALRFLPYRLERETDEQSFDIATVMRELRITLGSLPEGVRNKIRSVCIMGIQDLGSALYEQVQEPLSRIGLSVKDCTEDVDSRIKTNQSSMHISPYSYIAPARQLLHEVYELEFLPPRIDKFKQIAGRISARSAFWIASSVAAIVVIVGLAFMVQYLRASSLEKKWRTIQPIVVKAEKLQGKIRSYRPWFDDSIRSLTILKKITSAFPEEGSVWVKSLEIKEMSKVVCAGEARSNGNLGTMLDKLRETPGVEKLQIIHVRGESPLQFTFSFQWNGGKNGV